MISVIVPIYNVEKYLNRCVESILAQTYGDFELILVDDGSTDKSGVMCDEYKEKDERIIVVHKSNGGLSSARNTGIKVALGEYLTFIDGDDYINPNFLEVLHDGIKKNNAQISMIAPAIVDEEGKETEILSTGEHYERYHPYGNEVIQGKDLIERYYTKKNGFEFVTAWGKLYKRDIFGEISFPEGRIHEDEYVFVEIYKNCNSVACISEELYYYIQRIGGIMSSEKTQKRFEDMKEIHEQRADSYRENQYIQLLKLDYAQWLSQMIMLYDQSDVNLKGIIKTEYRNRFRELKNWGKSVIGLKHYIAYISLALTSWIRKQVK